MQEKQKYEPLASQPIVVVHQAVPDAFKKGYYADNLGFCGEGDAFLSTRSASDVYSPLSYSDPVKKSKWRIYITGGLERSPKIPVDHPCKLTSCEKNDDDNTNNAGPSYWKFVVSGSLLAASILILYLWIQLRYINPILIEIFKIDPLLQPEINAVPKINKMNFFQPVKTDWKIDYDVPTGIPVIKLYAKDMTDLIDCPPSKFALVLHIESDSDLAESWLKACGQNVAYFRIDGDQTPGDVDRLLNYLKDAEYIPLKATLKVEKDGNLLDNPDFQKTKISDEVTAITRLEVSGYVTSQIINELVEALPYAEDLSITGDDVCKTLRQSLKSSAEVCQVNWSTLQKLHIFNTIECRGMYDLIYSCWNMPKIETLQIRKSIITDANSAYIIGILDRNRITKVDFADNTCFDETPLTYPFMCQSSVL